MLDARQIRRFFEVGYLILEDVFSPPEVERMRRAFHRLEGRAGGLDETCEVEGARFVLDREAGGVRIHRVVWCGAVEPELERIGADPRLLGLASRLLGSATVSQLINQAHFKLPGDGVAFPWHQDSTHRRYGGPEWRDVNGRGSYVQTVLAVDDVTAENGPIELIPGSCRVGHLGLRPGDPLPEQVSDIARPVAPTMRAGSVMLFGPYTFHASRPNRSTRPRRVLINGYAYPGANLRVYPGSGTGVTRRVPAPAAADGGRLL